MEFVSSSYQREAGPWETANVTVIPKLRLLREIAARECSPGEIQYFPIISWLLAFGVGGWRESRDFEDLVQAVYCVPGKRPAFAHHSKESTASS